MKYFISILISLIICQVSFSQHDLTKPMSEEQTQKDKKAYTEFLKKKGLYAGMQEYMIAREAELYDWYTFKKRLELFTTAADKGNPLAEEAIGSMYVNGDGNQSYPELGREWLWKAIDHGNMDAFGSLSVSYWVFLKDAPQPKPLFYARLRGANAGSAICCRWLAGSYEKGHGTSKDPEKYRYWMAKATIAEKESKKLVTVEDSQVIFNRHNLSEPVLEGQIPKDKAAYIEFLKKESFYDNMKEYTEALEALIVKDYTKEVKLLNAAAAKGNPLAEEQLGTLYSIGQGVAKDEGEAFKWFWMAIDHGNMDTFEAISDTYDYSDEETAYLAKYFMNALLRGAYAGSAICCEDLADAYKYGDGTPKNNAKASYWSKQAKIAEKENKKLAGRGK